MRTFLREPGRSPQDVVPCDRLPFQAMVVSQTAAGHFQQAIVARNLSELPPGEVLIRARYSSLKELDRHIEFILQGKQKGRIILNLDA